MAWAALGAVTGALGLGFNLYGRREAGQASAEQAAWNRAVAEEDMKVVQFQNMLEVANIRRAYTAHAATMQARSAGAGVRANTGSAALALVENASNMAVAEEISRIETETNLRRLASGATLSDLEASNFQKAQRMGAVSDVLGTATQVASLDWKAIDRAGQGSINGESYAGLGYTTPPTDADIMV